MKAWQRWAVWWIVFFILEWDAIKRHPTETFSQGAKRASSTHWFVRKLLQVLWLLCGIHLFRKGGLPLVDRQD